MSTIAKCVGCDRKIRATGDVTSNFVKHLRVKHSELYAEYKSLKSGSPFGNSAQAAFDRKLLHANVDGALPVSILERRSFIDLLQTSGMKIMSRQAAVKKLKEHYGEVVHKIKSEMASVKHFCTTGDIWSGNHRSFLGYTCHWLTENLERKSAALACRRIFGVHSAEKIAQIIAEINAGFGLNPSNVIMTVTDNGSNFVKAFKEYGCTETETSFEDESENDLPVFQNELLLPKHLRCCSHTLNLLASADYVKILRSEQALYIQHSMTFEKCNALWRKCKWPKSSEIIVECLGSTLLVPVVTRWNSLFDAVTKLLWAKDKLNPLCERLSLSQFSPSDLQYLEMYQLLMGPIARALDYLQGENNVNYGCLIPTLMTLSNRLDKLQNKPEMQQVSSVVAKLEQRLRDRFDAFFTLKPEANIALAATVLTPDIKMSWIKVLQRIKPEMTAADISTRVLNTICDFYAKDNRAFNAQILKSNELFANNGHFDSDLNDTDNEEGTNATPEPSVSDRRAFLTHHFFCYLNDNSRTNDTWVKHCSLKEAFVAFNTPLTSSAPVERLFSFAGIVNSPRRQSMSDLSFEKLVLLKANSKWC
ncbi:uncharacterized protein LOC125780343 [Bactrocera dorsalis]|uniref:Uncharacterized protein LOC125780343 n=1 Tax=Bactrocera dorsalis TaxID=27457 RepID=A0ABM3KAL0_BACDO|nr:uncharacterized protein LOC125780343 [Bactrocera dorsalis]